ncbi:MAG: sensor histidine kinase, partial [Rubrivivax sp.]|nr:sensor histidine kinase [Rubrivivax sp.]
ARVPMVLEIADLTVGVERAIPLGLMINELVSNAYRHGYDADTAAGRIVIRLAARLDGRVGLEVRDDGRGLPSDFGAGRASTLGMQLVRTLAQQLGAELDWETGPEGTCFRIVFALDVRAAQTESM